MTSTPSLPDYQDITKILEHAHSQFDASQVHGLFCGLICAEPGLAEPISWEKLLFRSEQKPNNMGSLYELYETSYHLLSEFSFEFSLLLPTDTLDINARAESLGLWCQGFLTGLEQGKIPLKKREASDVTDALNDIIQIAEVSFGDIVENDEDETAYFELVEYVRLSVLMIFQDLKVERPRDEDNILH
jgi:uncharacterized protein